MISPQRVDNSCLVCIAGSSTSEAIAFIKDQFVKRQPKDKTVYTHVSCAIDTDLMRCIIRDVNIIVEINLRKANMPLWGATTGRYALRVIWERSVFGLGITCVLVSV